MLLGQIDSHIAVGRCGHHGHTIVHLQDIDQSLSKQGVVVDDH